MVTIWVFTPSCVYWLKCFSCLLIMDNKRMNVVKLEVKYSTHNSLLYKHGLCDVLHRLCKSEDVLIYCIILQLYMMFTWIEWSAVEKRFKMVTTNLIIVEEENIIFFCKKKINVRCLFILSATYCREDRHSLMSSKLLLYISLLHQLPLCGTHSIHFFGYIPTYLSP